MGYYGDNEWLQKKKIFKEVQAIANAAVDQNQDVDQENTNDMNAFSIAILGDSTVNQTSVQSNENDQSAVAIAIALAVNQVGPGANDPLDVLKQFLPVGVGIDELLEGLKIEMKGQEQAVELDQSVVNDVDGGKDNE